MDFLFSSVPLWSVIVALVMGAGLMKFFGGMPFVDKGNTAFVVTNKKAKQVLERVAKKYGNPPAMELRSDKCDRTFLKFNCVIVTEVDQALLEAVEFAGSSLTFEVSKPFQAAQDCAKMFQEEGFEAIAQENLDPSLPKGVFATVTTNAAYGKKWMIAFRRHVFKMGKKPTPWRQQQ